MGAEEARLQSVTWREGSNLDPISAHSSSTTEEHAKELATLINARNPEIDVSVSPAKEQGAHRVTIGSDAGLQTFKSAFPAVKVEEQRQHMSRIREGHPNSNDVTTVRSR